MSVVRRIDGFLFGAESGRRLLATQLLLTLVIGLRVALGPYRGLAGQPAALFRPVWFLRALPMMPPLGVILALQAAGVVGVVLGLAGPARRRRIGFVVAWLCLLVLAGLRSSRGKVLHNDVLLLLVCVPFLAAPAADEAGGGEPSPRYGWPLRTALVVVAGAYFFAGFHKLQFSGLAWVTSDNVRMVMAGGARGGRATFPAVAELIAARPWLAHVVALAALAFELTFPVVLFRPRLRPLYAAVAVVFHAATWLTLGIDYWVWTAVIPLLLVDCSRLVPAAARAGPPALDPAAAA